MTIYRRTMQMTVYIDAQPVEDVVSVQCSFSTSDPVAKAQVVLRSYPKFADNNKQLEILCGATPGSGDALRFLGIMRAPQYGAQTQRRVTITGLGTLNRAAEYFNWEDYKTVGGLLPQDLLGVSATKALSQPVGTAGQIISAVLQRCGVRFNASDIHDTGRMYPWHFFEHFVWNAGTPSDLGNINQVWQDQGQSGLDYIQTYNQIEAEYSETVIVDPVTLQQKTTNPQGGFYKIFETLGGRVVCIRIGGRPRNAIDSTNGTPHVFVEGVNITDGRITRGYPVANTVLVKGFDRGDGLGPEFYCLKSSNPLMGNFRYSDPQPPNSQMIEHSTVMPDPALPPDATRKDRALLMVHGASDYNTAGAGMDCETVAKARMLEVNRVPITGSVTTVEDWIIGPGQTVLVAGTYDSHTGNTLPDRLATNEKLWVESVTINCADNNGAPQFTQELSLTGGGWPDNTPQ